MADVSFIKELPFTIQVVINVAIFMVTLIIGLKSYWAGKQEKDAPKDVIVTSSNAKFLEEMQESFETLVGDVSRVADSMEGIEKSLQEMLKNAEIDREVRRITGERKRGGKRQSSEETPLDTERETS